MLRRQLLHARFWRASVRGRSDLCGEISLWDGTTPLCTLGKDSTRVIRPSFIRTSDQFVELQCSMWLRERVLVHMG